MARSVPEWIGKDDDAKPTKAVRERIFARGKGCCHICGGPIAGKKWHADHVIPLRDAPGGNRESNMLPAHEPCHLGKTAKENAERAKITRQRQKQAGIKSNRKQKIASRPFASTAANDKSPTKRLPPRPIYVEKKS